MLDCLQCDGTGTVRLDPGRLQAAGISVADVARALDKSNANAGYCVFGKVVAGMDVVDKIKKVKTVNAAGLSDVPAEDVVIESVRRVSR